MPNEHYFAVAVLELERLKILADRAIAQMPADGFFAVPGEGSNSVAVIVKHMAGNLRSRWTDFLTADGEKPDRRRDAEFLILPDDSRERLQAAWEAGWAVLFTVLRQMGPADVDRIVTIRGEPLTVLQAVNRQLTHYAYHVGQIVYLAKFLTGRGWRSLSIPVGESERFNRTPTRYMENK